MTEQGRLALKRRAKVIALARLVCEKAPNDDDQYVFRSKEMALLREAAVYLRDNP
jgi:hypothetical protein